MTVLELKVVTQEGTVDYPALMCDSCGNRAVPREAISWYEMRVINAVKTLRSKPTLTHYCSDACLTAAHSTAA